MADTKGKRGLDYWKDKLTAAQSAYEDELSKMNERETYYRGNRSLTGIVDDDKVTETVHLRNICAELVEAQIDNTIPSPKVTALRREDEGLAKLIEDMLKAELDRLPTEEINDIMERTVTIQGGGLYLAEWDSTRRGGCNITLTPIHPKQFIPQDGVLTGIEDMDYCFLRIPQTKDYLQRRYGVDLSNESEEAPEIRSSGDGDTADDMITQYIVYYRNEGGGVGIFSFACDQVLEDIEDYQTRIVRRCDTCSEIVPTDTKECPFCGGTKFSEESKVEQEVFDPILRSDESSIGGMVNEPVYDEEGNEIAGTHKGVPTKIPYYKPNVYPIILQKNISLFGQFLGDSDIDKIKDQQNTLSRTYTKMIDLMYSAGSVLTLPNNKQIEKNSDDMKVLYIESPQEKSLIDVLHLQGDISQNMALLKQTYEEAKEQLGITDAYLGRKDSSANSATAKQFSAQQTAGRLESKRIMKNSAYAKLFEVIFKFKLAFADELIPVATTDERGQKIYRDFNRYDFLRQNEKGVWIWNDDFLFSCDTSAPLSQNREGMWQEMRLNLQSGAFGDPTDIRTLIMFWKKMEECHYPGALATRAELEARLREQQEAEAQAQIAAEAQAQADAQAQAGAQMPEGTIANQANMQNVPSEIPSEELSPEEIAEIEEMARAAAAADVNGTN